MICSAFVAHKKKAGDKLQLETPALLNAQDYAPHG